MISIILRALDFLSELDGEWHPVHDAPFMRRRAGGKWQYRPMTDRESYQFWI